MSTVKDLIKKIKNETVTLADQELALKHPETAYWFAYNIQGADIDKCQEVACQNPFVAYYFVKHISKANLIKIKELCPEISDKIDEFISYKNSYFYSELKDKITKGLATLKDQDKALKVPQLAYLFAVYVKGADVERCQKVACKDPEAARLFACDVPGADIEKCQDVACQDPFVSYSFAQDVPGADIEKCIEGCKGTVWEDELNEYLMERALE